MTSEKRGGPWRVLIASSHPLFAEGLRGLLQKRPQGDAIIVGLAATIEEALSALREHRPDLVIVDYDDKIFNRDEILARFVEGEGRLRVVLLSLGEGGDEAIVYDRRTMAASQIEDWLEKWTDSQRPSDLPVIAIGNSGGEGDYPTRRKRMKHAFMAAILVVILTILSIIGLEQIQLLPEQSSVQAEPIDFLFDVEFKIIAFLFALIVGLMLYSIIVFRRKPGDDTDAEHVEGSTRLEVLWTLAPLATVLYISFLGAQVLGETLVPDPQPLEVRVVGSQWSWRFEYPQLGISGTELRLPVNKQVLLQLRSTDVIHSFWVPEFRLKQDALPGGEDMVRELRITPKTTGEYKVRCAEMCGLQHAYMTAPVLVLEQGDFQAWVDAETSAVSGDPVARGQRWVEQFGCLACHTTDGTPGVGPTWQGLYGSQEALQDGTTVEVDPGYLRESIVHPGAKITEGFQNIMPPDIAQDMSDEQIQDVIAFIESLK
jgi:cytochrome c oxidase subunit 2